MVVKKPHKYFHILGTRQGMDGKYRRFDFTMHAPDAQAVYDTVHSNTFKGVDSIAWVRIAEIHEETGEVIEMADIAKLASWSSVRKAYATSTSHTTQIRARTPLQTQPVAVEVGHSAPVDLSDMGLLFEKVEVPAKVQTLTISKEVFRANYTE